MNAKINILYARLSKEDSEIGDSGSITNQIELLTEYAERNGLTPILPIQDDGFSGTSWTRPGWQELMRRVDAGDVATVLVKNLDRIGRDHLRVGLLLEQFQERGIRLIAVGDNVDTAQGVDDFIPLRTLFAEWFARDTSRKIRAINNSRTRDGKHVTGAVPYGYLRDPNEKSRWTLDEEAAPIVRRIFQSVIDGKTVTKIAEELTVEGVLIPSAHWQKVGAGMRRWENANPTKWAAATVLAILRKEEYTGKAILNKTVKETHKSKRKPNDPENVLIFQNAHPAIVDEEMWLTVQRLRETRRIPQRIGGDPNPLTGILYCADCGHKMYHKQGKADSSHKPHDEYCCSSYRHHSRSCTCHYIRVEAVEKLILRAIKAVSGYALGNEAEFIEKVRETSALQAESAAKESRKKLTKSKRRREEVSGLIKKLYESYATGKIPENTFTELLAGYNDEQADLDAEIERLQTAIDAYYEDGARADKFLELAKRHTEFEEFSAALLNRFVERVIVHEADKSSGRRVQEVEIVFNFIGKFDMPEGIIELPAEEKKQPKRPRTDAERERDRRRYAKIRAARIAAQEAERAAILENTRFAV